ncbi:coat protein [ssRNA phage Gephyllon.2_3]|jgi:hypothetical protein|uniref:Coat protein n=2 Tax=Leviviricetes TaxID=2842243 RepID=A0A8S5KYY4_9VIRU|nr:coat protein [ssRNA phage Gephyllon.2_3]QDH88652.1 MAG: hypothetical protein H2RhizoLitter491699_000003 [Leviviridae sp.]QDH91569.1 MAG: hypothetical protein H2BulkLitter10491_000002 [Leviviridae sp.]DAD50261.1 TPA_asm: coat protein [ssRNA phage Gephyllon.2_3]
MAFADPQSVTINGSAKTLPRVSSGVNSGQFKTADGLEALSVSHQYGKRVRHMIRLDDSKIASDPLLAGQSIPVSMSAYLVVDVPTVGYSAAEQKYVADALVAYLTASTGAKVTQLLGGEN